MLPYPLMAQTAAAPPPITFTKVKLPEGWHPASFLLVGDSSSGKSTQAAELARALWEKAQLKTRWYCLSDNYEPALPGVEAGYIEIVDMRGIGQAPYWLPRIAQGTVAEVAGLKENAAGDMVPFGKFQKAPAEGIGLFVFDSLTGISDQLMADYADYSKAGVNIGGGGSYNYDVGSADWGGVEKMGSNNQSHYGEAQRALLRFADKVNQWSAWTGAMVLCTATMRRDSTEGGQPLLGPQLAGKALTSEYPRKFTYCANLVRVAQPGKTEMEHELRFDTVLDLKAGGAMMIGNNRLPLKAKGKVPSVYRPADLVKAYGDVVNARRG